MTTFKTTLTIPFTFDAAHRLDQLPVEHKCHQLHGHTFSVLLTIKGVIGIAGMVADFDLVKRAMKPVIESLDHKYLNDIDGLSIPTVENIAGWIAFRANALVKGFVSISVQEGNGGKATVTGV